MQRAMRNRFSEKFSETYDLRRGFKNSANIPAKDNIALTAQPAYPTLLMQSEVRIPFRCSSHPDTEEEIGHLVSGCIEGSPSSCVAAAPVTPAGLSLSHRTSHHQY